MDAVPCRTEIGANNGVVLEPLMPEEQDKKLVPPKEGKGMEELTEDDLKGVNGGFSTALRLESEIQDGVIVNHQNRH